MPISCPSGFIAGLAPSVSRPPVSTGPLPPYVFGYSDTEAADGVGQVPPAVASSRCYRQNRRNQHGYDRT
jgi:hypothetical protein